MTKSEINTTKSIEVLELQQNEHNPFFQPEIFADLANALYQEINKDNPQTIKEDTVNVLIPHVDTNGIANKYCSSPEDLSSFSLPSEIQPPSIATPEKIIPQYYFLEGLNYPTQEKLPQEKSSFYIPHVVDQSGIDGFDVQTIRHDFPILQETVNGKPLIWFDNAATTQKPQAVIDRLAYFYSHENSNIHRAAHELASRATDAYEEARGTVANFINASSVNEIIFVRGTTEGINLVAKTWGVQNLKAGDEIILTHLEHHANIVPWQQLASQTGAKLRVIPVDNRGQIILSEYQQLLNSRTKLVAFSHLSNALGTITPAHEIIDLAHRFGAKVLLDAAQSVPHIPLDVQSLDVDWLVFSGHKIFAPTGIGVVYGKEDLLNASPPWQGGGNMIVDVTFDRTIYRNTPTRFEAGTGNIADAVGLATALKYVQRIGLHNIARYEHELLEYATEGLKTINGLHLIGTAEKKASVISFILDGFNVQTIGETLNKEGIAVRAGHHCAQPILRRFGLEATVRPSFAFYNTKEEIDVLVNALDRIRHQALT